MLIFIDPPLIVLIPISLPLNKDIFPPFALPLAEVDKVIFPVSTRELPVVSVIDPEGLFLVEPVIMLILPLLL